MSMISFELMSPALSIICSSTESMHCLVNKKKENGLSELSKQQLYIFFNKSIFHLGTLCGHTLPRYFLNDLSSEFLELSTTWSRNSNESRLEFILFPTIGINFNFSFSTGMFQIVQSFKKCAIQHLRINLTSEAKKHFRGKI